MSGKPSTLPLFQEQHDDMRLEMLPGGPQQPAPDARRGKNDSQPSPPPQRSHGGDRLRLLDLLQAMTPPEAHSMVLGMMPTGKPLLLNLCNARTQHLLILGSEQSGKSEFVRTLVVSLALTSRPSQVQILGIDVGGRELALLDSFPHALMPLVSDARSALDVLGWLDEEIGKRERRGVTSPKILLVVDDVGWLEGAESGGGVRRLLRHGSEGPRVGVHLLLTARPGSLEAVPGFRAMWSLVTVRTAVRRLPDVHGANGRFVVAFGGRQTDLTPAWLGIHDLALATQWIGLGWQLDQIPAGMAAMLFTRREE